MKWNSIFGSFNSAHLHLYTCLPFAIRSTKPMRTGTERTRTHTQNERCREWKIAKNVGNLSSCSAKSCDITNTSAALSSSSRHYMRAFPSPPIKGRSFCYRRRYIAHLTIRRHNAPVWHKHVGGIKKPQPSSKSPRKSFISGPSRPSAPLYHFSVFRIFFLLFIARWKINLAMFGNMISESRILAIYNVLYARYDVM